MGQRTQILYAPCGAGKCHGKDTPILMADGTIKMVQDVLVGDKLISPDGSIRNVLSLGRGTEEMYLVTPKKGTPYTCNASHILSLRKHGNDGMVLADGRTIVRGDDVVAVELRTFIASNKTVQTNLKGWRSSAISFPEETNDLPIPPYILGAWLGDGNSNAPAITKPASGMVDEWAAYAESIGLSINVAGVNSGRCPTHHATGKMTGGRVASPITSALRNLNVIDNKHIPLSYKTASIESRLQLLAGLIDSDGSHTHGGYDWISKHQQLAEGFAFVARSLGFSCYITKCKKSIKSSGFTGEYWRCSLSGDTTRIPSRDKPAQKRIINKRNLVHGISISPIGVGDYFGFELDGDHLYLLGDFTVCHNTEIAVSMMHGSAKKQKRSAMLLDLKLLCAQTSSRFQKYDIDHGVIQPESPRYRPELPIQVCMVQTLEARGGFPSVDLLVVDEAHTLRESVREFVRNNLSVKVVGLSGSPFTKGLSNTYTNVVSACTVNDLIKDNYLISPRVFIAKSVDMTGAKKIAGEWSDKEATERGIKITGDIVAEWVSKTTEIFGEPRKTIVFCAGVAHGADLVQKFSEAGYNFISVSYKDADDYKKEVLEEFAKPDSTIHGLIATDLLTKGFDVADVCIGVSARPFSKSFSAHVQQLGRIMRPHNDKDTAVWLDHSGNYLRFKEQWDDLCANGVSELDDGAETIKPEPTEQQKEAAKCPKCNHVWNSATDTCAHCGFVRARKNEVITVAGEMTELTLVPKKEKYSAEFKQDFYAQLIGYGISKGHKQGAAFHRYIEKFGVQPSMAKPAPKEPTPEVLLWIKSRQIAYAKGRKAA